MKIAYVSLAYTDNYLPMAAVVYNAFVKKFNSKYPFILMVTQNVDVSKTTVPYKIIPRLANRCIKYNTEEYLNFMEKYFTIFKPFLMEDV